MASAGIAEAKRAIRHPKCTITFATIDGARAEPSPTDVMTIALARPWNFGKTHRDIPWAEPGYVGAAVIPSIKRQTRKAASALNAVV